MYDCLENLDPEYEHEIRKALKEFKKWLRCPVIEIDSKCFEL